MKPNPDVIKLMIAMAAYYGQKIEDHVLLMYAEDVSDLPLEGVKRAFHEIRRDPKVTRFPLPALIRERVGDGRPGVEEAWAMIPKDEASSVVWTTEMREAFGTARLLLEEDPIAARMAFKETYQRLITQARSNGERVRWEPSLGHDKSHRDMVLRDAVSRGRMSIAQASELSPEVEYHERKSISFDDQPQPDPEGARRVREFLEQIRLRSISQEETETVGGGK